MAEQEQRWSDPEVIASRSVLVEVMTILASDVEKVVVVGGWVPELLYPGKGHIGSLDVDLALDGRKIKPAAYDSIRKRLVESGYRQAVPHGSIFLRDVAAGTITVKLDLITGEGDVPRDDEAHTLIQEMLVAKLRGTDLAARGERPFSQRVIMCAASASGGASGDGWGLCDTRWIPQAKNRP